MKTIVRNSLQKSEERKKFEEFILANDHPCLMAQSVFRQQQFELKEYGQLGNPENTASILSDLEAYVESYDFESSDFFSFIAIFSGCKSFTEKEFEEKLWQQLQDLHDRDSYEWDSEVAQDPKSDHFSFSICGKAFYVIGMHPNSSRKARQSPRPTLVFNLHHQFEKLREIGTFDQIRNIIRERDTKLQGSVNPMLKDFGKDKEAHQYSGRKVGKDWKCPFAAKKNSQ